MSSQPNLLFNQASPPVPPGRLQDPFKPNEDLPPILKHSALIGYSPPTIRREDPPPPAPKPITPFTAQQPNSPATHRPVAQPAAIQPQPINPQPLPSPRRYCAYKDGIFMLSCNCVEYLLVFKILP